MDLEYMDLENEDVDADQDTDEDYLRFPRMTRRPLTNTTRITIKNRRLSGHDNLKR